MSELYYYTKGEECKWCVKLDPVWEALISSRDDIKFIKINCLEDEKSMNEEKTRGMTTVPHIVFVHNNERHIFRGRRTITNINKFINKITNGDLQ
jgi:hypothetical protein